MRNSSSIECVPSSSSVLLPVMDIKSASLTSTGSSHHVTGGGRIEKSKSTSISGGCGKYNCSCSWVLSTWRSGCRMWTYVMGSFRSAAKGPTYVIGSPRSAIRGPALWPSHVIGSFRSVVKGPTYVIGSPRSAIKGPAFWPSYVLRLAIKGLVLWPWNRRPKYVCRSLRVVDMAIGTERRRLPACGRLFVIQSEFTRFRVNSTVSDQVWELWLAVLRVRRKICEAFCLRADLR